MKIFQIFKPIKHIWELTLEDLLSAHNVVKQHKTKKKMDVYEINNLIRTVDGNPGRISDGYHTFDELYEYRMLYNAAFFNELAKLGEIKVFKSKKHYGGDACFGGNWFIVQAELPTGQISNHYEIKDWDLFQIPEQERGFEWDGHTPEQVACRIREYLKLKKEPNQVIQLTNKQKYDLARWLIGENNGIITGSILLWYKGVDLGRPCGDIDIILSEPVAVSDITVPPFCKLIESKQSNGYTVHARYRYLGTKIEFIVDQETTKNSDINGCYPFSTLDDLLKAKKKYLETSNNEQYIEKTKRDIEIIENWRKEHNEI